MKVRESYDMETQTFERTAQSVLLCVGGFQLRVESGALGHHQFVGFRVLLVAHDALVRPVQL
jgi:hypothetical protein